MHTINFDEISLTKLKRFLNKSLLTFPLSFQFAQFRRLASSLVFFLLTLLTLVEIFDDDSDEHVQHEKPDQKQERNEVQQAPFVVVYLRLKKITKFSYVKT